MSENPIVEFIPKEAAKEAVKETAKLTRELGGFLSKVFGTLPQDTVGVLGGDWLHHIRIRNAYRLQKRTEEILRGRGAERKIEPLSPSVAIPLLKAAQDESRDEIQELWARLLANAMDRVRPQLNRVFIDLVKTLDVLEARIIKRLGDEGAINKPARFLDKVSKIDWRTDFDTTPDQFAIALSTIETFANIEITCTTDRVLPMPVGERLILGQPTLGQYYDLDDLAIPYVTEFDKAVDRFYMMNAIPPYSDKITITNIIGTITMQNVGRELLRALSLTNEPVREPYPGSKRHEPPKAAPRRRRRS
jgi:hypothetical protein